jgi:osmotically-inducible protein OsmY
MKRMLVALSLAAASLALAPPLPAAPKSAPPAEAGSSQPVKDAYLKGRIVSALAFNPHVSVFDLDVRVDDGVAYLTGAVDDAIERDLAVEIARGVDDVRDVRADIAIKPGARKEKEEARRPLGQTFDDAATTAVVKSKLVANRSTPAGKINVTTRKGVVTLTGTVDSDAQKDLAGRIAENTDHVAKVNNELTVARR